MPVGRSVPTGEAEPFESADRTLEASAHLFAARARRVEAELLRDEDEVHLGEARATDAVWTRHFHACFAKTGAAVPFCERLNRLRLNRNEREVVMALVLSRMGIVEEIGNCAQLFETLALPPSRIMPVLRSLGEGGRLCRSGLIFCEDPDEDIRDRALALDPTLVEMALQDKAQAARGWNVKTEAELYDRLGILTRTLNKKNEELERCGQGYGSLGSFFKMRRRVARQINSLEETLDVRRNWGLAALRDQLSATSSEWTIVLALLGKELGHLDADIDLFKGIGLARAAARDADGVRAVLGLLMPDKRLVARNIVGPCDGSAELLSDDPKAIEQSEFELTEHALEILGLDKKKRPRRNRRFEAREPRIKLNQIVLSPETQEALALAVAQAKNARVLLDEWGVGEIVTYGRGVTLLFSGPPGTGKTACAEALAGELERPVLVANYSEIQCCYVGQTEKNIVKVFREARESGAVLFWDEADAMFYDRDSASRNWEVRDVNVLLQELERFEGVCVLATNRKITLDQALERRIAIKVEFARPARDARKKIWQKLLPRKMPLAKDVELNRLAEADLSGGEIKNAVLNAARLALQRNGKGPVTMADLLKAVEMETGGKWSERASGGIGFGR